MERRVGQGVKATVVGAGITGITTAYYLYKAGYDVTVFDKEPYAGMKTSYANGGQLSVSNSETWTSWSNVVKGLKWMLKSDAPFLIRPSLSPSKIKWLTAFLYETCKGEDNRRRNSMSTVAMGLLAREEYYRIADETGINFDLSKKGILHFYKNAEYFDNAKYAMESIYRYTDLKREVVLAQEVPKLEPKLAGVEGIIGGIWTESDSVGDIHKFCSELADWLSNRGVRFQYNVDFDSAFTEGMGFHYDNVVICAGADSAYVAGLFNESINVYPVKGYSITIKDDPKYYPTTSLLDDEAKIVTSTLGDRFRVAGTAELDGWNLDIRKDRIDPLLRWVHTNFPDIDTRDYKPWAGLRPMTPSMMPIVRRGVSKGVYLNTGHGHLGWTLSPSTAQMVVQLIDQDNKG